MRGDSTIFQGDTFVEVAGVYYTTILDDPQSFVVALKATETYVRSKIKKGKGAAVGAPGGKLERLEMKYANLGFQDIFYLTRLNLGLPASSLCLPPPSEAVRARLVKAGYQLPDSLTPPRGRPTSVKDLSRPGSRTATPALGPQVTSSDRDDADGGLSQLPSLEDLAMGRGNPWDGPDHARPSSTLSAALLNSTRRFAQMPSASTSRTTVPDAQDSHEPSPIVRSRPLRDLAPPGRPQQSPHLPPLGRPPLTPSSSTTSHWSTTSTSPELTFDIDAETARDPFASRGPYTNQPLPPTPSSLRSENNPPSIRTDASNTSRMSSQSHTAQALDSSPSTGPSSSLVSQEEMARFGIRQTEMIRTMMDFERFKQDMGRTRTPPPEYAEHARVAGPPAGRAI